MLPKSHRIPRSCFQMVYKSGKRIHGNNFSLIVSPVPKIEESLIPGMVHKSSVTQPLSRFAVVVPKKVAKRAVDRNRMKRLVSESLHHLLPTIKPGIDCIIIAKTNFADTKQQDIKNELIKQSVSSNNKRVTRAKDPTNDRNPANATKSLE